MSIVDLSAGPPPEALSVEVLIIGSGSGGATAARVLAEAGRDVCVLEEGGDFTGAKLTQREGAMYDQLYMDRGGRMTEDLSITILQGRVLGGGGVINASDVVSIPDGVLDFWQKNHGLSELTKQTLAPFEKRALEDLSANPIQDAQVNRANQLVREGAEKLGFAGHTMQHNRVGCAGLGTCLIGCPINAKQNPRMIAIPKAIQAGARIFTRARAIRIDDATQSSKRVQVRTLDPKGYHERGAFEIRAKTVIVACNAVATPQLLLRSGIGNEHVGRHLMLQPQLPITAIFEEKIDAFRGIPQSYAVTEFENEHHEQFGLWGFRIEPVMGTPGMVASLLPFTGPKAKEMMTHYPRLAASLLLAPDEPSGTVGLLDSGRPVVRYAHKDNHKSRLRTAVKEATKVYLAAGAKEVIVPTVPTLSFTSEQHLSRADDLSFRAASAPLLSAHQQGSARMSHSAESGAIDPDGQVFGTKGVYVFDGSVFPSSASSHTMTPIMTIAHFLSARMLSNT